MAVPEHVWVDVTNAWTSPQPGLLIAWRHVRSHRPSGGMEWEGWVISADSLAEAHGGDVDVRQGWLPAHLIKPAETPHPEPTVKYRPVNSDRGPG